MHLKALFGASLAVALSLSAMTVAFAQSTGNTGDGIAWDTPPDAPKYRTVEFHRALLQIGTEEPVGKIYDNFACIGDNVPIYVKHSGDMAVDDLRRMFADEATAAGYPTAGGSMFGPVGGTEANLLVAGAITRLNIKSCAAASFSNDSYDSTADVTPEPVKTTKVSVKKKAAP
jgi:hypothetical protein